MTKPLSPVIAAIIVSAAFGGTALASGDYSYQGAYPEAVAVDTFQTSSIRGASDLAGESKAVQVAAEPVDHGDYYEGANRPN